MFAVQPAAPALLSYKSYQIDGRGSFRFTGIPGNWKSEKTEREDEVQRDIKLIFLFFLIACTVQVQSRDKTDENKLRFSNWSKSE